MHINGYRALSIIVPLLCVLSACSQAICDNTPYCLNPPHSEIQPSGTPTTPNGIYVAPGTQGDVEITIGRSGLPAGDPVYFVPGFEPLPAGAPPELLVSTTDGITVSASREPFTSDMVTVHVTVPAALPHGQRLFEFGVRRVQSRYADTRGPAGFTLNY